VASSLLAASDPLRGATDVAVAPPYSAYEIAHEHIASIRLLRV